jgi:hypothetical protein
MEWADATRRMKVRTNAETPADAETARKFGAEGIGLCRTEHMFFEGDRIVSVRQMILADAPAGRRKRRSTSCCRCSAATSASCSRSWPACRSRSACSIRRCTSSCPHRRGNADAVAPIGLGRKAARARRRAARVQPDARPSRLPAGDLLPGNCRRCRPAPSSRPPSRPALRRAAPVEPEIMVPLVAFARSSISSRRGSMPSREAVIGEPASHPYRSAR